MASATGPLGATIERVESICSLHDDVTTVVGSCDLDVGSVGAWDLTVAVDGAETAAAAQAAPVDAPWDAADNITDGMSTAVLPGCLDGSSTMFLDTVASVSTDKTEDDGDVAEERADKKWPMPGDLYPASKFPLPREMSSASEPVVTRGFETRNLAGDCLHALVAPGDIMVVRGTGGLMRIGAAGGLMGHVMVVLSPPHRVAKHSQEGGDLEDLWPEAHIAGDVRELWRIRTMEATRREAGLYVAEMVVYVDRTTRRLHLCGEVEPEGECCVMETAEPVEIWQSPELPRDDIRTGLMEEVVSEMRRSKGSWSAFTAARAVLQSAGIAPNPDPAFGDDERAKAMNEIRACWEQEPICTSVAITFWQRYLCKVASVPKPGKAWVEALSSVDAFCYELILKYMPLKADRGLPGELLSSMDACGWIQVDRLPRLFQAVLASEGDGTGVRYNL